MGFKRKCGWYQRCTVKKRKSKPTTTKTVLRKQAEMKGVTMNMNTATDMYNTPNIRDFDFGGINVRGFSTDAINRSLKQKMVGYAVPGGGTLYVTLDRNGAQKASKRKQDQQPPRVQEDVGRASGGKQRRIGGIPDDRSVSEIEQVDEPNDSSHSHPRNSQFFSQQEEEEKDGDSATMSHNDSLDSDGARLPDVNRSSSSDEAPQPPFVPRGRFAEDQRRAYEASIAAQRAIDTSLESMQTAAADDDEDEHLVIPPRRARGRPRRVARPVEPDEEKEEGEQEEEKTGQSSPPPPRRGSRVRRPPGGAQLFTGAATLAPNVTTRPRRRGSVRPEDAYTNPVTGPPMNPMIQFQELPGSTYVPPNLGYFASPNPPRPPPLVDRQPPQSAAGGFGRLGAGLTAIANYARGRGAVVSPRNMPFRSNESSVPRALNWMEGEGEGFDPDIENQK